MANLKNINFMSKERFDELTETSLDELYAVKQSVAGMPDYSAGIAISSGYEATENGWVISNIYSDWGTSSANGRLLINGVVVSANYHSAGDSGKGHINVFIVPISKGDVVTYTSNVSNVVFYPVKGAN